MIETPNLDAMFPEKAVYTAARAGQVIAAKAELSALRQRCEDLELMLRAALDHGRTDRPWIKRHKDKFELLYNYETEGWSCMRLSDDGTGLPLLTPESRTALRREVK